MTTTSPTTAQPTSSGEFRPRIESRGRVHCAVDFDMANCTAIEVDGGWVLVDCLSNVEVARRVRQLFAERIDGPLLAIIYTHGHHDHIGGAAGFCQPGLPIWAHEAFAQEMRLRLTLNEAIFHRGAKQFGYGLPAELVATCGIGPPLRIEPQNLARLVYPSETFAHSHTLDIGGVRIELRAAPGETHDHLFLWLPEERTLLAGDNLYRAFPNLYAIRGVPPRPIQGWIDSLDAMRRLDPPPEFLVLGHTAPVEGAERIRDLLTTYRDAICFVHDSVIRGINAGKTPDELVREVHLPPHLAGHEYLQEHYGTVAGAVRGIYGGYIGWFDGQASHLDTLDAPALAARLLPLLGGATEVRNKASAVLSNDPRFAAWLCDLLLGTKPSDRRARQLQSAALHRLAAAEQNPLARNWQLSDAAMLGGTYDFPKKPRPSYEAVRDVPVDDLLALLPRRIDPLGSAKVEMTIRFHFTDTGRRFLFFIRRGVGEMVEQLAEEDDVRPDLLIRTSEEQFKRIIIAAEKKPRSREFWQEVEFSIPQRGVFSPLLRLRRLMTFARCLKKA